MEINNSFWTEHKLLKDNRSNSFAVAPTYEFCSKKHVRIGHCDGERFTTVIELSRENIIEILPVLTRFIQITEKNSL